MTVVLPTSDMQEPNKAHNAFPGRQAYLRGFDETVEVLSSLQRPKKLTMLGDDGQFYPFLCKPKDDLRKDARLMDFNSVVNKLLRRDAECRRRELHIRTYMVTPLNEECGLLEWVPYTTSYRHIMMKLYRERGCYVSLRQAQQAYNFDKNSPVSTRMPAFRKLLEKHPPVFGEWFLRTFPDPTTWYAARVSYAHTLAVMSIVGYILGLGDRHGENILFDATSGHVVHVDFNCLFNKGETFDWPEVVPFRLTANMVEAMGPLGYEGVFRRACEVTLRVMREEIDPLMSVLKPFIYDPLVEWSKPQRRNCTNNLAVAGESSGEINNEKALVHVTNIEDRLKGVLKSKLKAAQPGLPLSIEGQVKRLIQEAASEENLCLMYFGWAAYM